MTTPFREAKNERKMRSFFAVFSCESEKRRKINLETTPLFAFLRDFFRSFLFIIF